ncbi:MAG: hypothetical protein L0H84_23570 [Pseudonocardia sp.]|nr:hypothetical protein [Pseudonocardia sp.]
MTAHHRLLVSAEPGGLLFTCEVDDCGRRLAVDRTGRFTVIDRGDLAAQHSGSIGGVELAAPEVSQS